MSDTMPVTTDTVAAWLRAALANDVAALQCIADTSDPGELLVEITRGCLELLHGAVGIDVVEKALDRWQQQAIEREAAS